MAARTGFYGCSVDGDGRLVRIAWEGQGRPPKPVRVDGCPVCGGTHRVTEPLWREPRAVDREREPDVRVAAT